MSRDPDTPGCLVHAVSHLRSVPGLPQRGHEVMPKGFTSSTTDSPDLFNPAHYPIRARCQTCGQPVKADSPYWPFQHTEGE